MDIKVIYQSRGGNTQRVAPKIAEGANSVAQPISEITPSELTADLLFWGGGTYMGKVDAELRKFVAALDSTKIKRVAVFSTSGGDVPVVETSFVNF